MKDSKFVIYNASAGSGKTYSLTKKYLQLLLSGNSPLVFRRILAITFTNKAVGEMKSRILDSLYKFSKPEILSSPEPMFKELCSDIGLNAELVQKKCGLVLKQILHNYSFFEISTIDKFNHKILKTFSWDLQISQTFEVELDMDSLLERAVSNLLERAGQTPELTQALLDFSLEKIEEEKSWNIAHDLIEIGRLLFQENHLTQLKSLSNKSISDLKTLQIKIGKRIGQLDEDSLQLANNALAKMTQAGFEYDDFPRKTLPNHFVKITEGERKPKALYNNKLLEALTSGNILKAKDDREVSELSSQLLEDYLSLKKVLYTRVFLRNVYSNVVPLTVVNELAKEIKRLEEEEDVVPISRFNQLISEEIKNQPVPFIYERLGEKYRHYFIDEFQDTSKMQWQNLIPLVANALESGGDSENQGSLFLVGDLKQAIYRWRGGSAEQFLHLLNQDRTPFITQPQIRTLETNWRSYSEIIAFNNHFFSFVGYFLGNNQYNELYQKGSAQKENQNSGGYVDLLFLEQDLDQKEEQYCRQVFQTLLNLRQRGFQYSDICILVRDNGKGALVANFLSEYQIPLVSSDSLLLSQNPTVNFLISLLNLLLYPAENNFGYEVLSFLASLKKVGDKHDFIFTNLETPNTLLRQEFGFDIPELSNKSTFDILESAIVQFDLALGSEAYITFLMDEVLEVEKKNGPGISVFLEHWERKKNSLSITAPEFVDAVTIMTIHKAKGLEFPVVIFPFANSIINDSRKRNKIWVTSDDFEADMGFKNILMNFTSDFSMYPESAKRAFEEEEQSTELDAVNVLYVALTRAEKELYLISEMPRTSTTLNDMQSYAHLFRAFVEKKGRFSETKYHYTFGNPLENMDSENKQNTTFDIPYATRPRTQQVISISTVQGQFWDTEVGDAMELGNLVHEALAKIIYHEDVAQVLEVISKEGKTTPKDFENLSKYVNETVSHPLLKTYFTPKYKIYSEREILTESGETLRPDRIVIDSNEATVLDFKTGKPSPKHNSQILRYSEALKAMGFSIKNTIIVYIGEEVQPLFL